MSNTVFVALDKASLLALITDQASMLIDAINDDVTTLEIAQIGDNLKRYTKALDDNWPLHYLSNDVISTDDAGDMA